MIRADLLSRPRLSLTQLDLSEDVVIGTVPMAFGLVLGGRAPRKKPSKRLIASSYATSV